MAMKNSGARQESKPVTVRHLINSLSQICLWIDGIVVALQTLPPETELKLPGKAAELWRGENVPLRTTKECPPPE